MWGYVLPLVLAVVLFGQTYTVPTPATPPGDTYIVETDGDPLDVMPSLTLWSSQVPVTFLFHVGPTCEGVLPHRICVHLVSHTIFGETLAENHLPTSWVGVTLFKNSAKDGSEVFVDVSALWPDEILLHELGHAIGLDHDVAGTIMYDSISPTADKITCRDVAQWYHVRKRAVPLCSNGRR